LSLGGTRIPIIQTFATLRYSGLSLNDS
jgi:hypothetical protein